MHISYITSLFYRIFQHSNLLLYGWRSLRWFSCLYVQQRFLNPSPYPQPGRWECSFTIGPFSETHSCRTRPPSMTSPPDWNVQRWPSMNSFRCSIQLRARFKVAIVCTPNDLLTKMIHHSDLTFVQTADALSAAVLHDRISGNNTYQGWVRDCFRYIYHIFPDFYSHSSVDLSYVEVFVWAAP